jgi:hypothetical protein
MARKIYEARKSVRPDLEEPEVYSTRLAGYEEEVAEEWKRGWSFYNADNWTRRLIEDGTIFWKRRRGIDHYTMQLLTGYGIFNQYRLRINKGADVKCWDCEASPDDTEYALLRCPRWEVQCTTLKNIAGQRLTVENIVTIVTVDGYILEQFWTFCGKVMRARQAQGKDRQSKKRTTMLIERALDVRGPGTSSWNRKR